MKTRRKTLIICIAIPLILGAIAGIATMAGMEDFKALEKPPLSPPGWLFPVVWSVLYVLMGIASYLVLYAKKPQEQISKALKVYAVQLAFNFLWSFFFFSFKLYYFAFFWLVVLWILILITIILFYRIRKPAAYLLIPYIIWVTFAAYLNLSIAILN